MSTESRDFPVQLLDALDAPLCVLDHRCRLIYANSAFCRAHGLGGPDGQDALDRPLTAIPGQEDFARLLHPLLERCLAGEVVTFREWLARPGLGSRHLSIHLSPWQDTVAKRPLVLATCRDITAQTLAEEALRTSQERFKRIFETMHDAYIRVSLSGEIEMANPAAAQLLGFSTEQLLCLDPRSTLCEEPTAWDKALGLLKQKGALRDVELLFRHAEQRRICCACNLRLVHAPDGRPRAVELAARDITRSKQSETELSLYRTQLERRVIERTSQLTLANKMLHDKVYELVTARRELSEYRLRLRELASEISLVQERERRRLALELHDGIVQDLAMARIRLSSLAEELQAGAPTQELPQELKDLLDLIKKMIRDSRSLVWEMGSPELYELGLEAALEELVEEFGRRYGLDAVFRRCAGDHLPLAEDMRIMLFQMARELLANVVKHARAATVHVELSRNMQYLSLHVEDDGQGFDPEIQPARPGKDSGFGLFSIRERLNLVGGSLELRISHLGGAHCCITLPLTAQREAARP